MAWTVHRWREIEGLEHGFGGRDDPVPCGLRKLRQVHGRTVLDAADLGAAPHDGDGLLTAEAGVRVGVATADCVPVLLVAPRAHVAAAVHAGWRGAAAGVVPAALELFLGKWSVPAGEIEAALGPAIGGCCYEVGEEVRAAFAPEREAARGAFAEREGRLTLDLRAFLAEWLRRAGVARVEIVGPCTSCRTDLLYSYRKQGSTGRQLGWIGWS